MDIVQNKANRTVKVFNGVRVTHNTKLSFDNVLSNLRNRVGETTVSNIVNLSTEPGSVEEFEAKVQKYVGESGFMLFAHMDHGTWMAKFGIERRLFRWIFGNPLIAITMLKHDYTAGLFVPVELLLAEDDDGIGCSIMYVVPSSLIAVYGNADVLAAAKILDDKVEALVAYCVSVYREGDPIF